MATSNAKSDWFENKILTDNLSGTLYMALFTSNPNEAGVTASEISGEGGYARKPITFTITGNQASNTEEVNFGLATADWGIIANWAIMSDVSNGNIYYYGFTENSSGINTSYVVNNGDTIKFPVGAIVITEE